LKKILREDLAGQAIGRFQTDGVWVECAKDPTTNNIIAVTLEYPDDTDPVSIPSEKIGDLIRWYGSGYSVQSEAIHSRHFQLYVKQVFRAGKWDGKDFNEQDVQAIANNNVLLSANGRQHIPIMLDHGDNSKEKIGHIAGLRADNGSLIPEEFVIKDEEAIENILIGLWDTISPFIVKNFVMETGAEPLRFSSWVLYEVSIVVHPRDYGLAIRFSADNQKKEVKMDPAFDDKTKNVPGNGTDGVKLGSNPPGKNGDDSSMKGSQGKDEPKDQEFLAMSAKLKTLEEENKQLKQEKLQMSSDFKELNDAVQELKDASVKREAEDAIKTLEMSGRLAPAQHEKWVGHYLKMSDDMRKDWFETMKDAPKVIAFGQSTTPDATSVQKKIDDIKANLAKYNNVQFDNEKGGK
jgi:hypothetical protein